MPLKNRFLLLALVSFPFLTSCNIYRGFASPGSTEEYIEEAQKCLADQDYACAVSNYEMLPAGAQKNEKLCVVNIARAGLGLTALIDIITSSSTGARILGDLATQLLPYTAVKEAAAAAAIPYCLAMTASDTATMLKSLAYMVDCSIRIAKTDTLVSATNGGIVTCDSTIAGNGSGTITSADIGGDGAGSITTGTPGMCQADVHACSSDITNASALTGALASGGLSAIANNITLISGFSNAVDDVVRLNLKTSIP